MAKLLYLACLLGVLGGLLVVDARYRLVLWRNTRRAAGMIAIGVAFFLAWDMAGIGLHIFRVGSAQYMTGLRLAPQLPIEEPFFLALLVYQTMLGLEWLRRRYAD